MNELLVQTGFLDADYAALWAGVLSGLDAADELHQQK
jgi:hypothetical protein